MPEKHCFFECRNQPMDFCRLIADGYTAAFVVGEPEGLWINRVLYEQRIRIPDDFSVVSMEYPRVSDCLTPPHTTLAQDFAGLAKAAVELLGELMVHDYRATDRLVPYRMIERGSVKTIPGA